MQTTLLGLGIAIILALVAALIGPYFIDWSEYRNAFEAQASRLVGMPVRITGRIDARMLPVPSLKLRGLEAHARSGEPRFIAQEISVEFALGPLMRGEWRASEMRIVGPRVGIGLAADGRVDWSGTDARIEPDSLVIERLSIEDGRIILADAVSATSLTLDKFWFNGDLRSLAGPIKGEGGFTSGDKHRNYRLTAGRMTDDGMRVRLALDSSDRQLSAEVEGNLRVENGAPRFEGGLTLSRLAGVTLVKGRAVANEPWRLSSRVKTNAASAVFEQIEVQYGPEDRALKVSGTAELRFGKRPRLDAVLSARQLDLDRFVALPEATRRLPLVALQSAAEMLGEALQPTIPVRVGLGIDALTLAEATVQTVRGDFSADATGWNIETLEFRAPGATQVRASGRFASSSHGPSFTGPATVEASDPRALAAWLEGGDASIAGPIGPLRASGEVTLASDRIAVDRLQADIDRKSLAGRVAYTWGSQAQRPRLDAALNAAELDLDAAATLLRTAVPGLSLDYPAEVMLALDIGRATIGGVAATNTKARLKLDADGLMLERVAVGDLGGAAVEMSGRIQGPWTTPRGALILDLAGNRLDGVLALLAKVAPQVADALSGIAPGLSPAKLKVMLALEPVPSAAAGASGAAKILLSGTAGPLRLALSGDLSGSPFDWRGDLRTEGSLEAAEGRALAGLFGLDRMVAVGNGPGSLRFSAAGPLGSALRVQSRLIAAGVDVTANGTLRVDSGAGAFGAGDISATIADAAPLRPLLGRPGQPAPLAIRARLAFDPDRATLDNIAAKLADSTLTGRVALTLGGTRRFHGRIDADFINAGALLGALAGMPVSSRAAAGAGWPAEPFVARFLADRAGDIELSAARAPVNPFLEIRQLRGLLRVSENEAVLEDVQGVLAGGRLVGNASFQVSAGTTAAAMTIGLTDADVAALLPGDARAPVTGRANLHIEAKGSGRTPSAVAAALAGTGTISVERLELAGLDPQAFDTVIRSTDQGVEVDAAKIKAAVEKSLDSGRLKVARAEGSLTVTTGQLRLGGLVARGDRADLGLNASVDLGQGMLDARLALLGSAALDAPAYGRPEILVALKGPLAAPKRTIDVSTLVGWLTLRAVDLQAKRLEAAEAQRQAADEAARRMEEATRRANEEAAKRAADAAARRAAEDAARRTPPSALPPPIGEQAPNLPPPVDVRPLPGQRRPSAQRPSPRPGLEPEQEVGLQPRAHIPPARPRSLLDTLFGPPR